MSLIKSKLVTCALLLTTGAVAGFAVRAAVEEAPPAYLIVSGTVLNAEGLNGYREKARPLARAAGIKVLARSNITVLEGSWPHNQKVTVERFPSLQAVHDFWYSEDYQQAMKLREGNFKADFIIAVEGKPN